ncbi:PIG-L family deacetylase [uncultured Lutibacter sp.]|uniref:PIG-L deacetylase family protein n=1 Tax=uncultured Lutibacter sp. TaxID=437739 RepID=UPI002627A898|nr:PIG-L family deacetylase [uncultured Lutibacter sp.]
MIRRFLNKVESIYKYKYFANNEKGAYNFLLDKIYKSTDINFIENCLQLDYFREILIPQEFKIPQNKNILVLAPHQDDEIIGCGGTILKLLKNNNKLTIGFLTNGAELSNPLDSIKIRHKEAKKVCNDLGCKMLELGLDNISMNVTDNHLKVLVEWIKKDWDYIFTIWPLDQPPKHRLCSYIIGKICSELEFDKRILFYAVHTDLLPNFYVDITDEINTKQDLLKNYTSQLMHQRYDHMSKGLDAWRSRFLQNSNKERYIETFTYVSSKSFKDFNAIYEKTPLNNLFKGNRVCIRSFKKLIKQNIIMN